jgi:plasmid stabilization system protein ParE
MKIIWTEFATAALKEIYVYYKGVASIRVAQQIKTSIFSSVTQLKEHPKLGQIEQNLLSFEREYRYLVSGHYKIIYRLDQTIVYITDVFDCRQNPQKMKDHIALFI